MIIHVFKLNLKAYQLNFGITRGLVELHKSALSEHDRPFFVYYGKTSDEIREKYEELFYDLNNAEYQFCMNEEELRTFVYKHISEPYLLHGVSYKCIYLLIRYNVKNLNWVCWGQGSKINFHNWKSIIFTPVKYWMYHHFRSTVVLLDGDRKTLARDYGVRNIKLLPYFPESQLRLREVYERLRTSADVNEKPVVYLGNSGHCIDYYFEFLNKFRRYVGKIEVHCMLQYISDSDKTKERKLIDMGKQYFGDDFYPDTTYMDMPTYLQYMNHCDVYICGAVEQSGLGAIGTSLALGKKVYITGKNYNHIISQGCKVFNVSSLDDSFITPLSENDKILNYNIQFSGLDNSKQEWNRYLATL